MINRKTFLQRTIEEGFKNNASGYPTILKHSKGKELLDYKIHGNSVQNGTPTPDIPVEVESVGYKTINLYNIDNVKTLEKNSDNTYSVINIANSKANASKLYLEQGEIYSWYIDIVRLNGTAGISFRLYNEVGISVFSNFRTTTGVHTFTVSESGFYYALNGPQAIVSSGSIIKNLMIIKGNYTVNDFPEYEPYGYKLPVNISGKNLWKNDIKSQVVYGVTITRNEDGSLTFNGTATLNARINFFDEGQYTLKAGTYTLSGVGTYSQNKEILNCLIISRGNTTNNSYRTFTLTNDVTMTSSNTYLRLVAGYTYENYTISPQLEYSSTKTFYEPYIEPVATNIYVDEPLRKIGDYADYIDFKKNKIFRNIYEGRIDENTSFGKFGGVTNYSAFFLVNNNLVDVSVLSSTMEYYQCATGNTNDRWTSMYQISGSIATTYKRICFTLPNTITSIAEAKEWLATNPIKYYYIGEQTEETIELPAIPTHKGTNIITVGTEIDPSNIEVEYNSFEKEV